MHAVVIMNTMYIIIAIQFFKMCSKHFYHLDLEHNSIHIYFVQLLFSVSMTLQDTPVTYYEKNAKTVIVNISTNINKTNNYNTP